MAADKASSNQSVKSDTSRDQTAISEDITRIVGYLNTKRSNASERASGLVQEISHRREDLSGQSAQDTGPVPPKQLDRQGAITNEKPSSQVKSNPALAERYHSFCHDLDVMLDGFRARVDGDKPVQH